MIIKNAIVCDADGERDVDVRVEDGIVTEIGSSLVGENITDAARCLPYPLANRH
ncbi:MAG: hypothetical protein Q9M40_14515 [Sulfurimonas sp.]|nr:hypothetical protein [Sulfurimonas sp.]